MKIRNGFVSNSSSTSFIVVFPQIPKSDIDVMQMMFGNPPKIRGVYCDWGEESSSIYDVAGLVFDVLSSQHPNDKDQIYRKFLEYHQGHCTGLEEELKEISLPSYYADEEEIKRQGLKFQNEEHRERIGKIRDKFWKDRVKVTRKLARMFMSKHKDKVIYVFSFGDHGGTLEANCEQGNIFRFLPHIKINEH